MPINRDLSGLPAGRPPDREPRFGPKLAEAIYSKFIDDGPRAKAIEDRWFRASMAGMCSRAIALGLANVPETNPPSIADEWRMWLGKVVHDAIDSVVADVFPEAEHEVDVDLIEIVDGSAHLDLLFKVGFDAYVICVEVKTMNGFAYKLATTSFKGDPEGPKLSAILQGGLAARALDADELVILVFAMENISPSQAKRDGLDEVGRFTAEWTFSREQYLEETDREVRRLNWLHSKVEGLDVSDPVRFLGEIPPIVPDDDGTPIWITNPAKGAGEIRAGGKAIDFVSTWQCDYCRYRDLCVEVGV